MGRTDNEAGYGKVNRFFTKPVVVLLMTTIIGPIIAGFVVNAVTKDRAYEAVQKATVEMLSANLDYIDASDKLKDAVAKIASKDEKYETLSANSESVISEKEIEIKDLKEILENMPNVEYNSISIVKNGQKTEDGIKNGLAIIDGKNYYSEDSVNSLLESKVYLDKETKSLFYDTAGTNNPKETKVALEDTEVLYDGERYRIYKSPSTEAITLGSTQYKTGFTLSPKYGYPGKALFDLGGNYSKICFDVGRVTGASAAKTNEISVYFGEEFVEKIEINPNVVSKHVEIELNNTSEMIIKVSTSALDGTSFGFVNVILEY